MHRKMDERHVRSLSTLEETELLYSFDLLQMDFRETSLTVFGAEASAEGDRRLSVL